MKLTSNQKTGTKKLFSGFLGIIVFLIIWMVATNGTNLGKLLTDPITVIKAFIESFVKPIGRVTMPVHILVSLKRMMIPFVAASIAGVVVGITMGWYPAFEAVMKPWIEFVRPIPPIAWIPISILWFGFDDPSKYFLIFLSSFPTIAINTYSGVKSVDQTLVRAGQMLGAKDNQIFTTIVIPSTVPHIFAGLQVAIGSSWATIVAAEMIRSSEGVGWIIISGQEMSNMTQVLIGIVAIAITGLMLVSLMRYIEGRMVAWNDRDL